MCVVDRLLEAAQLDNRWFKAARKAESLLKSCVTNKRIYAAMYLKGLLIRYNAGERSEGLLEELEEVN